MDFHLRNQHKPAVIKRHVAGLFWLQHLPFAIFQFSAGWLPWCSQTVWDGLKLQPQPMNWQVWSTNRWLWQCEAERCTASAGWSNASDFHRQGHRQSVCLLVANNLYSLCFFDPAVFRGVSQNLGQQKGFLKLWDGEQCRISEAGPTAFPLKHNWTFGWQIRKPWRIHWMVKCLGRERFQKKTGTRWWTVRVEVRILFDPAIFLDSSKGQLFHYCGDWEFLGGNVEMEESYAEFLPFSSIFCNIFCIFCSICICSIGFSVCCIARIQDSRAAFVQELRRVLGPVMKNGPKESLQKRLQKCRKNGETQVHRGSASHWPFVTICNWYPTEWNLWPVWSWCPRCLAVCTVYRNPTALVPSEQKVINFERHLLGPWRQAMLDEQEALFERPRFSRKMVEARPPGSVAGRSKLHKLMEQEGLEIFYQGHLGSCSLRKNQNMSIFSLSQSPKTI